MWRVPESTDERTDWPVSPPPPWPARVRATLWWHRSAPDAAEYGPGGATLPITLAMMVDYLDSPVGPYREILASPVLRRGLVPAMAVPFIAVDSEPSVHGGREHWKLPKVLASFSGDVTERFSATGDGWKVTTAASPRSPELPIGGGLRFAQPAEGGGRYQASARLRGRCRLARVTVDAEGPTLSHWLRSGTHYGMIITSGTMRTGPARRVR
ncbi:acetoacetate decarboxylase family protein [Rhodococcus chondri]|uniref:Acetoacetate decarboxylase family protein n=1 Tax=Rhodococcus chondri TaxID=3065941 RepID=A0ABU7JNB4_9NOCA|nr:acetoacetate decarboxylase family protein [Rhodococcus sp. CC-R104]MEE2030792.1 acetoacetate decarboxylase family protein [Rhodococcus sp. CC-R104]